jgi:hypothetical protein
MGEVQPVEMIGISVLRSDLGLDNGNLFRDGCPADVEEMLKTTLQPSAQFKLISEQNLLPHGQPTARLPVAHSAQFHCKSGNALV